VAIRCYGCMKLTESDPVCEHCGYDARSENSNHQLPVGTIVGNQYILGKVLGQGGFGITYMGYDRIMQQPVAVKEYFPSGYAGRDTRNPTYVTSYDNAGNHAFESNKQRFLREAESLAKLWSIPQVVRVLRHFEENGTAYIAMEYVEGMDLRKFMKQRERPLTMEEMLDILGPVIQGLSYVHRAELVHRDISPDNIMVLPDGSSKLLDFGAARYVENANADTDRNTSTQAILKHGFAPPEQYRSRGALGPWTDIYAMCATVYYCLSGRVPPESMSRMMDDSPLALDGIPGLTPRQKATLKKGMSLRPKDRIKTAEELYQGLFSEVISARENAVQAEKAFQARLEAERRRLEEERRKEQARKEAALLKQHEHQRKLEARKKAKDEKDPHNNPNPSTRIFIAAVLAILVIVLCLFSRKPAAVPAATVPKPAVETLPTVTFATETPDLPKVTNPAGEQNVLMLQYRLDEENTSAWYAANKNNPDYVDLSTGTYFTQGVNETIRLSPTGFFQLIGSLPVFGTDLPRNQVRHVVFLDSQADAPANAWDLSRAGNRTVLGWAVELEPDAYTLYLAGEGGVGSGDSCEYLFYGFTELESIAFNGCFHTQQSQSMAGLFLFCQSLKELDISTLDTGNVTDMSGMFGHCASLTELDLSTMETGNATTMQTMFSSCKGLIHLDISNFDTRNVTNMCQMFRDNRALITLYLGNLDTSKVTDMGGMFGYCSSLTTLDVSSFDTSSVTNMSDMFASCSSLTTLDVSNFDTSSVTDMSRMFLSCHSLQFLDISGFTSEALVDKTDMFSECYMLPEEVKQFGA